MTTVTVTAQRSEDRQWWVLQCEEHPGAIHQVQDLQADGDQIKGAIAWVSDIPEEEIEIHWQVVGDCFAE